jgi:hypothetical protein
MEYIRLFESFDYRPYQNLFEIIINSNKIVWLYNTEKTFFHVNLLTRYINFEKGLNFEKISIDNWTNKYGIEHDIEDMYYMVEYEQLDIVLIRFSNENLIKMFLNKILLFKKKHRDIKVIIISEYLSDYEIEVIDNILIKKIDIENIIKVSKKFMFNINQ